MPGKMTLSLNMKGTCAMTESPFYSGLFASLLFSMTRNHWVKLGQTPFMQQRSIRILMAAMRVPTRMVHAPAVQRLCFWSDGVAANFGSEAVMLGTFGKHLVLPLMS